MINIKSNVKIVQTVIDSGQQNVWEFHNLVVSTGLDTIRNCFAGLSTKSPALVVIGSGTTPAYSTDTALQTPTTVSISLTTYTLSAPGGITYTGTIGTTVGVGSTFAEIGLLSATSYLYARALINPQIIKTTSSPTVEHLTYNCEFSPTEST